MIAKKFSKNRLIKTVFGCLFAIISLFSLAMPTGVVYAEPADEPVHVEIDTDVDEGEDETEDEIIETETEDVEAEEVEETPQAVQVTGASCEDSLGGLGWWVCPQTGKISEAVDWLYKKIEDILVINPVEAKDGSPIYEIWKYAKGLTNIVFIIFMLVVIYSQLTGVGISNYGIKKTLPKLIVVAILVNLSFIICSLAVDISNIVGNSLRGLFTSIEMSTLNAMQVTDGMYVSMAEMYASMAGGTALAIGATVISFETGAIWMLIPVVLGAIVAVASGLITIALRQAVVTLLIMISPLAIVAYMLPNTEQWFKKWKQLFIKMLVFYPMFSLLFGASSLAGWAIIASAKDGFGLLLGVAIQIFPLLFSWSLMKMSGTFLGTINAKMQGLAAGSLATNRAWAESRREATRQKYLASDKAYTPTSRLRQFLSDRRIAREEETRENAETVRNRGLAYGASRNYRRNGTPTREGEEAYARQQRNLVYARKIERHKSNMNKGLGQLEAVKLYSSEAQKARLNKLDDATVEASDNLKMELARGAKIEYENARGFFDRALDAENAHLDLEAIRSGNTDHQFHDGVLNAKNIARYDAMKKTMEGNDKNVNFILADAAHGYNAQQQIVQGKFNNLYSHVAPTQDVVKMLDELSKSKNSNSYIDQIVSGIKVLGQRGDTDLIKRQINNLFEDGKIELGTHASQSLAYTLMFDVGGRDPTLRRFGKYINLETAKMFNEADPSERRTRKDISFDEYVNGEYIDHDSNGNVIYDESGSPVIRKPKRDAATLLKGTSFKDMERTAMAEMAEMIRDSSVDIDENGNRVFNYEKFKKNQERIWDAIMPNIISDQFSFLSGSEQITALGKGLTGMDVQKHRFDWEGIFGKEIADSLTPEQKKDYIDFMNKRTKSFLGGQVPMQIAKTKTDILESVRNQYALKDAVDNDNAFFEEISKNDFRMSNDEYKQFEQEHMDNIKREFVKSYKEDALKGFVKMHHKGFQGEAKDGLIQLLNPDELYRQYFGNSGENNRRRQPRQYQDEDDDDDGMPVNTDGGATGGFDAPVYNNERSNIETILRRYNGGASVNVADFWEEIKNDVANGSRMMPDSAVVIDEIENSLSQYTSVATLYRDVIDRLFGGFEN